MTIKDAPPPSSTLPVSAGGPSNQATLAGEAPPPAYTVSPIYQGLGFGSSSHTNPASASTPFFPPPPAVAAQRARQRFFKALVVAFLIWVFVGAIFGGGIEDMNEDRDRDRHGRYPPPPRITYYQEAVPIASEVVESAI